MKSVAWIAGSLLILAMAQSAPAQQGARSPQYYPPPPNQPPPTLLPMQPMQPTQLQSQLQTVWPSRQALGVDPQPLQDNTRVIRRERLSPEERQRLRQDINEVGRDLYRHERR